MLKLFKRFGYFLYTTRPFKNRPFKLQTFSNLSASNTDPFNYHKAQPDIKSVWGQKKNPCGTGVNQHTNPLKYGPRQESN